MTMLIELKRRPSMRPHLSAMRMWMGVSKEQRVASELRLFAQQQEMLRSRVGARRNMG
jgi:hypothetical protein